MSASKGFSSRVEKALSVAWSSVTGKPADYPPASHSHAYADITGKPSSFVPSAHTHLWADITDRPTVFLPPVVGTVNVGEAGLVILALGVRRVAVALAGALTTGSYVATPVSAPPAGFSIQDCYCATNGQITVGVLVPVLTGGYSIPCKISRVA